MKTDDVENELRNLKNIHLTESDLAAYCDQELDVMRRARMTAHLKQCFICEQELALWQEEGAALRDRKIPADDIEFVERLMEERSLGYRPSTRTSEDRKRKAAWSEHLNDYVQQLTTNWRSYFGELGVVRGATRSAEIWRWESEDGIFAAYATMEKNADLTIHFSATEMKLEGARLHFRLGSLSEELSLRALSETEVGTQVAVPRQYRQGNMTDISIEIA